MRDLNNDQPLVSIIIPVYNGENYLKEAVDSALAQTYRHCEVLVINDGSTDRTEEIAACYGDSIRYYKKENGGVASALNYGISKMKGEYFNWLSHDDLFLPYKIEKQIEAIKQANDPTVLVQGEYAFFHEGSQQKTDTDFHKFYNIEQLTNSVFPVLQLQCHACSTLVHKSHFDRVGLFREDLRTIQDIEMWFRLFRNQVSVFLPECLHLVREHPQAGSCTIPCYYQETEALYVDLISQMDNEELTRVFLDAPAFLCRMIAFLKSYRGDTGAAHLAERLRQMPPVEPDYAEKKLLSFHERFWKYSSGQKKKIAIFGAGQYGLRMKFELACRLLQPAYFIDNNPEKWDVLFDGIPCVGLEKACKEKDDLLVVIAQRNNASALQDVQKYDIPYYCTRQQLDPLLLSATPAMHHMEQWLD